MPDNILDILGTRVYQGYVETPLQTLDSIIVNQPKWFLPLAEEAKHIAKEIRIEKINEQWAGIPHEQLLNQSFTDQLNSIQILEQLTPLQLAKEHLPGNIIDILKRLGKADNILFNQVYVVPPQSWGDQGDTKHSKCLLVGGRRLNQNDFNPQTERKWWRTGCDGPSRPSK